MENSRRNFLKVAGVAALGVGVKPAVNVLSAAGGGETPAAKVAKHENALTAKKWAMVIDTRKFESEGDLDKIIEACHSIHNVPDFSEIDTPERVKRHEIKWIWKEEYKHAFPGNENEYLNDRLKYLPFLVLCNHCEDPPCVRACPTQATFKREEDGIVLMDFHRCIGCRFCMAACPYGSRSFNFRDPKPGIEKQNLDFPTRMKGVVEKCNFCAERLAVGKKPKCVEASNGAIAFGDLDDPNSEVRELLRENFTIRRKLSLGTGPVVYYIV